MEKKRVRARIENAELGYAKGGSFEKMRRKQDTVKSVAVITVVSVLICALIVTAIFVGITISQKGSSGDKPKTVNVYYGELNIKTDRELVYDGSNVCIDMNCIRDMLSLTMAKNQNEITYSTVNGETIKLTVGENTVFVNGIQFSVASKTRDVKGKIFVSAEVVNRFISDTSVTANEKENSVSVVTLIKDPSEVVFAPKKSEEMSGINRPTSIPNNTTYNPDGTTADKITTGPDPVTTPVSTTAAVTENPLGRESKYDSIIAGYTFAIDITPYVEYLRPDNEEEYLIVANRKRPVGENFAPTDLVQITTQKSLKLRYTANICLDAMISEMKALGVFDTYVCSGYRDYATQVRLYNGYIAQEKKNHPGYTEEQIIALVDTYSARPGTSDHHTGLTVDFYDVEITFEETKAFKYLKENAYKFGFIMRYLPGADEITGYSYEPWHWRFVGQEAAYEIYTRGITLEEYTGLMD